MATKNIWAKARPASNPYLIITIGGWEWRVLRAYQTRKNEKPNEYARWFCSVSSPYTGSLPDLGDCYIRDIPLTKEAAAALDKREQEEEAVS